jgi:molybdopterin-guanine dinucleotide biosynthesis protein
LINVYGEDKSGKTYFIKEVARELVEREMYDVGVYYFDGGKIEN